MRIGYVWFGDAGKVCLGEDSCVRFSNGRQGKVGLGLVGRGMDCLVVIWKGMALQCLAWLERLGRVLKGVVWNGLSWRVMAGYKRR